MNRAALEHLTWKEYRTVRAFWLSIVVLVLLAQGFAIAFSRDPNAFIYSLAIAAPAFFALGCAGTAFAIEREEGTFEFLRAAPVSVRDVLASKLVLTVVATLAMYCVLWPLAMLFTGGTLPEAKSLHGILGLWLVAALEAIAWGTLFSLLSARPLVAICLAIAVGSTVTHLLAWSVTVGAEPFDMAPYLAVVPWRLLTAAIVLAADVYLGLRWLEGFGSAGRERLAAMLDPVEISVETVDERAAIARLATAQLAARSDRGAMLGHLLWQQWRQSSWLMVGIGAVYAWLLLVCANTNFVFDTPGGYFVPGLLAILAALAGVFVFRPDQEQRRHRFFVEHNIPPRWVWLSRQAPWLALVTASTLLILLALVGRNNFGQLWLAFEFSTNWWARQRSGPPELFGLPPIMLALACAAISYAAGQWASLFVRSGLLAGLVGLLLAALLCAWVVLMAALHTSWVWSVAPIPLVLLWSTWWRAPDWANENTTWNARARAGASVLLPALVFLVGVPLHRVTEVPLVKPGFDPAAFVAEINSQAIATGNLYRRADELYVRPVAGVFIDRDLKFKGPAPLDEEQTQWLQANAEPLALVLDAAGRATCAFDDPATVDDRTVLRYGSELVGLVMASARKLEAEGKLDLALARYLVALDASLDLNSVTEGGRLENVNRVLSEITYWAAQPTQTPEQIRAAIEKLRAVNDRRLRLDEALKSNFIVTRRYLFGDVGAQQFLFGQNSKDYHLPSMLWPKLLPWESFRGLRELNLSTAEYLAQLQLMRKRLAEEAGVVDFLPLLPNYFWADNIWRRYEGWGEYQPVEPSPLAGTLTPELRNTGDLMSFLSLTLPAFEAQRRGTIIVLAVEAYRREHGALPKSLAELGEMPHDPYSGQPFVYYPSGLPAPTTPFEEAQLRRVQQFIMRAPQVGWPCVWCTGPFLSTRTWPYDETIDEPADSKNKPKPVEFYSLRQYQVQQGSMPPIMAWGRGTWFPLPAAEPVE